MLGTYPVLLLVLESSLAETLTGQVRFAAVAKNRGKSMLGDDSFPLRDLLPLKPRSLLLEVSGLFGLPGHLDD